MQKALVFFLTLLSLSLSACGFHLRGSVPLAPPLQRLYIQSENPYSNLSRNLRQSLKLSGVEIMALPNEATTILHILREEEGQQMLSVGGTQQTRQYNLTLRVSFRVTDNLGNTLVPDQSVTESSTITIESNQVLAGSNQALNIYRELRRAIVFDIIYRLSSKSTTQLLMQGKKP